jgi:hypothetical protein
MDSHRSVRKVHEVLAAVISPGNVVEPEPLPLNLPFPGAIAMETGKKKRHSKMKNDNSIDTKQTHHTKKKNKDKAMDTKDLKCEQNLHHKMVQVQLSQEDIKLPSVVEPPALQEDVVIDAKPSSSRKEGRKSKKSKKKEQPSVIEPPALQEEEVIGPKPSSSRKEVRKSKKKKKNIEQPSVTEPQACQEGEVIDAKPSSSRKEVRKSKKKKKKVHDHHDGNNDDSQAAETPVSSILFVSAAASMPTLVAHLVDEDEIDAEIEERIEHE